MESYIPISYLNDFIFCPRSIYFHQLFGKASKKLFHRSFQTRGLNAHKTIDEKTYTTAKSIFQGMDVYCERYKLCGKIDLYDQEKKLLIERKNKIKEVYDGYVFQLYAQYFCLIEMGYKVEKMKIYSQSDNKNYNIPLPEKDDKMFKKFTQVIKEITSFKMESPFLPNPKKCRQCVYNTLCDCVEIE